MNIFKRQKCKVQSAKCKTGGNPTFCNFRFAFCVDSGFTLVEMMVSIAIFMVVAVVAVAALLKIVDANRKSQTLQDAVNNINFAMDAITREIRVGSTYDCIPLNSVFTGQGPAITTACLNSSGSSIAFLSSNIDPTDASNPPHNLTYVYYFAPHPTVSGAWTIEKVQQVHYQDSIISPGNTPTTGQVAYAPIIDPNIVITAYTIKVVEGGTNVQPSVFLYIRGYTGKQASTQTYFDIQTTISQRNRQ
jgi:type II secretory pathway pseudopilin PulG